MMWSNMTCVDDFLNRAFHKLGLVVGRHPGYFVVIPVLVAFICFTGYQRIHYEIDPEYLFSPTNGPSKTERAIVEQYFKVNYSHHFNLGRITRPGRFGHVIITSKDGNENLLRRAVFDELAQLDEVIRTAKATYEGEVFTYEQICARWLDKCFANDILKLSDIIDTLQGCGEEGAELDVSGDVQSGYLGDSFSASLLRWECDQRRPGCGNCTIDAARLLPLC
ncbi:patched domain-containing protein 1 isoform X3 [Hylaeus anthracinus]|uniref:patched domain-containing protein 1 isoform X3 n=1 Tax=Hylaeus volcanicus TaxID=313075 RepID=UPI0023B7C0AD|nr:patched domain-containing protein 1 isoform X3 [Hylaeus volcanicus]XP_054003084.1 patched domain-containing protein 1 isoform X3 [Hylaeus anthracinus]